jgi:hypothetical protein
MATSFFPRIPKAAALAASFVFLCGVAARADGAKVNDSGDPAKKTNAAATLGAGPTTVQTTARTGAGPTQTSASGTMRTRPEGPGVAARLSSTQGRALPAPSNAIVSQQSAMTSATARSANASEALVPMNAESPLPK